MEAFFIIKIPFSWVNLVKNVFLSNDENKKL